MQFVSEIMENREVAAVEQKRRQLDTQIEELDRALATLSSLVTKTK